MTHVLGVDNNSLYPSACCSNKHEFIKYTDNKMYMLGKVTGFYDCETNPKLKSTCLDIIKKQNELFIVEVKGKINKNI